MTRHRYIQINGELVEVSPDYVPEPRAQIPHVIPDIKPYRSMVDGSMITSRSQHREHLRMHNCVEVGNDASLAKRPAPLQAPKGLKETIARAVYSKLKYDRR